MCSFRFPASETTITAERHLAEASFYQHQGGLPIDEEEQGSHPGERPGLGELGKGALGMRNGSLCCLPFLGLRGGAGATRKRKIYRDRCPSSMDLAQDTGKIRPKLHAYELLLSCVPAGRPALHSQVWNLGFLWSTSHENGSS